MSLAENLSKLVNSNQVSTDTDVLAEHSIDKWFASETPDAVVFPESTEDVSNILRYAYENQIPVTTRGAGYGYVGGAVPSNRGIVLSTARMNRILEINPSDGVAVVEPGVITGDLQDAAKEVGWSYPPDPASLKDSSIGGNIATNAGGPRCLKYGVTRHYVLGLEVVLADGRVLNAGGRCHKNKTGFDLVGVFVGSEGMLGIVTKATLRLIPRAPARVLLSVSFGDFREAAKAVETVLGNGFLPAALEISDQFTLQAARDHTGTGLVPDGDAHLIVELDGHEKSVRGEAEDLEKLLREKHGIRSFTSANTEEGCEAIWDIRRAFSFSLRATGLTKLNEDVVVPRGKLCDLVEFCAGLQAECGFPIACFGHAGDGNIHVNIMVENIGDAVVLEKSEEALDQLFQKVLELGGAITGEHGVGLAKKRWFPGAVGETGMDVHRQLKQALDPNDILNPGKFI
ncbi:MAG: FAD-linked oxidase C-terminal domain-containing protein [Verrucomicrobiota bacterium]